jgi:UPF0716 protein FxsA
MAGAALRLPAMLFYLFLLFTLVPLVELWLLVRIAHETSLLFTIALVLTTGIVGAALARWQGFRTLGRIQDELAAGRMPADAMIDGVLILIAGLLLVTPGVLTDSVGFVLLIPPLRSLLKRGVVAWIRRNFRVDTVVVGHPPGGGQGGHRAGGDEIIDARVVETRVEDA